MRNTTPAVGPPAVRGRGAAWRAAGPAGLPRAGPGARRAGPAGGSARWAGPFLQSAGRTLGRREASASQPSSGQPRAAGRSARLPRSRERGAVARCVPPRPAPRGVGTPAPGPLRGRLEERDLGGQRRRSLEIRRPAGRSDGAVGFQIVSCDLAHTVPDTGRVRFSRSFVGEPGSPASLRHLSPCLGGTSGIDAEAGLARILSFRQEPPSDPV